MFDRVPTEAPNDAWQQREAEPLHPVDASDELLAILRRIDQLEAQAAATLAQMNEASKWRGKGYTSATAFLRHRASYTVGRATQLVWRSNSLSSMPLTSAAFGRGELSVDQADVLCAAYNFNNAAFLDEEASLVSLAGQLPFVDELYRLLEYWKQRIDSVATEIDKHTLDSLRGVRIRRDAGVGRIYGCVSEEELDILIGMLDPGPPVPEDRRSLTQRRADRLMELATAAMDRPQLVVHVGLDDLTGQSPTPKSLESPLGETEYGTVLTPGGVARFACDASVCRIVFGPGSQPLDVGKNRRLFTGPQRRAIIARDRRCRFPGCDRPPRWCDVHHLKHWVNGGKTCVDNGVLLCRFHHTLVHEAGWTMSGTPDDLLVYDDLGRVYGSGTPQPALARAP